MTGALLGGASVDQAAKLQSTYLVFFPANHNALVIFRSSDGGMSFWPSCAVLSLLPPIMHCILMTNYISHLVGYRGGVSSGHHVHDRTCFFLFCILLPFLVLSTIGGPYSPFFLLFDRGICATPERWLRFPTCVGLTAKPSTSLGET